MCSSAEKYWPSQIGQHHNSINISPALIAGFDFFLSKSKFETVRLEDVGVAPGDTLNVVKGKRQRAARSVDENEVTDMPEEEGIVGML